MQDIEPEQYHPGMADWVLRVDAGLKSHGYVTPLAIAPDSRGLGTPTDSFQRPSWSNGQKWVRAQYEHHPESAITETSDYAHYVRLYMESHDSDEAPTHFVTMNDLGATMAAKFIAEHLSEPFKPEPFGRR